MLQISSPPLHFPGSAEHVQQGGPLNQVRGGNHDDIADPLPRMDTTTPPAMAQQPKLWTPRPSSLRHQVTADTHRQQPKAAPGQHLLDILKESEQRREHLALERHKTVFY